VKPRVLMVTGAYFPETSGGGLQARTVIRALRGQADFSVLTTSADPSLPARSEEDRVPIRRVFVDVQSRLRSRPPRAQRRQDVATPDACQAASQSVLLATQADASALRAALQTGVHDGPPAAQAAGPAARPTAPTCPRRQSGAARAMLADDCPQASSARSAAWPIDFEPSVRQARRAA
jgi:hypothetical protein